MGSPSSSSDSDEVFDVADLAPAFSSSLSLSSSSSSSSSSHDGEQAVALDDLSSSDDGSVILDEEDAELGEETTKTEVRGWYAYDAANSTYSSSIVSVFGPLHILAFAAWNMDAGANVYAFLGIPLIPSSYFFAIVAVSVIVQFVSFVAFGATADYGAMRWKMLVGTGCAGAVLTMCFLVVPRPAYWVLGFLFVTSNVFFGMSNVYYNSFLPLLVKNHPAVRGITKREKRRIEYEKRDNRWSGCGFAWGYVASLFLLFVNLALVIFLIGDCEGKCNHCLDRCFGWENPGFEEDQMDASRDCLRVFNKTTVAQYQDSFTNPNVTLSPAFTECESRYKEMFGGDDTNTEALAAARSPSADRSDALLTPILEHFEERCVKSAQCDQKVGVDPFGDPVPDKTLLNRCLRENSGEDDDEDSPYFERKCDPQAMTRRINMFIIGAWWLAMTGVTGYFVKQRASRSLPAGENYVSAGLKGLWQTVRRVKQLPDAFRFLLSFWMYSDGFWTFATAATIFAVDELNAGSFEILILLLVNTLCAAAGSIGFAWIHQRFKKYTTLRGMILSAIVTAGLICIYARIPGLLETMPELYVAGGLYGVQLGSMQSFSRVLLGRGCPAGHEAEFFALFEISNKGTSWLGPIVLAIVVQATRDVRWGVMSILPFMIIGGAILMTVNEKRMHGAALIYAKIEREKGDPIDEEIDLSGATELGDTSGESTDSDTDDVEMKAGTSSTSGHASSTMTSSSTTVSGAESDDVTEGSSR